MRTTQLKEYDNGHAALELLASKIEEAKARNPRLSLRAFAARLGMSSGALSEILSGKRPLTNAVKRRIAPKLLLSPQETIVFFRDNLPEKMAVAKDERFTLSQDQFHLISDWWYFGLLNLIKTRTFRNHAGFMARRLGLSVDVVKEAWARLFRMGLIVLEGNRVVRKHPHIKTSDLVKDLSIRKSHLEDLKLIETALLDVPLELRDNTSCTFVVNKADLPKAKEMIRIFQSQFLAEIGQDQGEEVYKMSIALYPLTQSTGEH